MFFFDGKTFCSNDALIFEVFTNSIFRFSFQVLSFIIPLDVFKVLCSDTVTFRSKNCFAFRRLLSVFFLLFPLIKFCF